MKFGETSDSIYAYSFPVQEGYSTPAWPYDLAVQILEAIDGSVIDVFDFGAREHRTAEFNVNYLPRTDYDALKTWMDAHLGQVVRVEMENAGERVFGEQFPGPVVYAFLRPFQSLGEQGYTPSHTLNGFALRMDLAGAASSSIPNVADASKYDFTITVDCARITAGCQAANFAALAAITNKPGGSRGLTTDTLKVYFYNAQASTWEPQYTLPANDAAQGLQYGVFRWSAFADISAGVPTSGNAFKAGWLVKNSIQFPRYSIDLRRGPAVERPEGFSFSVRNDGRLWKSPLDRNLAWYGAYCSVAIFDRATGLLVPMRAGYNNVNSFDYEALQFDVEPGIYMQDRSFPPTVVSKDNYPDAADASRGQPVQSTYGRFDLGALQPVNFTLVPAKFPNGRRYLTMASYNAGVPSVTLNIDPAQFTAALGYGFASYPTTPNKTLFLQIIAQDDQPETDKLIKVTALADGGSGTTVLTLRTKWTVPPTAAASMRVMLANILLILDDDPCIGFRTPGYIKDTAVAGQNIPMELWGKTEKGDEVAPLPAKIFKPVGSGENQLTLDTDALNMDTFGSIITEQESPLDLQSPAFLHEDMDTPFSGYTAFNFGFSPDGVESNEVEVRPFDKITQWVDRIIEPGGRAVHESAKVIPGSGHLLAAYSNDRTTLIWTPLQGTTGYTLYRYLVSESKPAVNYSRTTAAPPAVTSFKLDTAFGTGGSTVVSGQQSTFYVDTSVSNTEPLNYEYRLVPNFSGGSFGAPLSSNRGQNRTVRNGNPGIIALGKDGGLTVAWALPPSQAYFSVEIDGSDISGMPFVSATQTYFDVPSLTNNTAYKVKVRITGISVGAHGDTWYAPNAKSNHPIHYLKTGANDGSAPAYFVDRDATRSNMLNPLMAYALVASPSSIPDSTRKSLFQLCYVAKNFKTPATSGAGFPAAAVVFSWALFLNHDQIGDLSDAKSVRILADFVCRLNLSVKTLTKLTITLRGLREDKSVSFSPILYDNLTGKAPTETDSTGAFFQFYNLPEGHSGAALDVNYNTEESSPNANGLYRGKDLWKLPDRLFENGAQDWRATKYLVFSITNAEPITWDQVEPASRGLQIGIGGPPGATWNMVKGHKSDYFLEVTREFKGGLDQPQYIRIDAGKKDVSGAITGTAGAPIEIMRHIADDVVNSMVGYTPAYIGTEMQSRLSWLGRWQTRKAMGTVDTLDVLARNLWGFFTFTPDDKLYFRSLDIEDPNVPSVFTFNDSNIVRDGLGKPEMRRRNEIFQKFRLQYNVEPSRGDAPTEEMLVGWDLAASKPILAGYSAVKETLDGTLVNQDSAQRLTDLCRLSIQINTAGLGANEYGLSANDPKIFELHYRPTTPSLATGELMERDLPNIGSAQPPKCAMQELAKMVVTFYTMDSWYFPLTCSLKNLIYNGSITGKKGDGSADNRLKLGDVVTVNSYFHTGGQDVRAFVVDIDLSKAYEGLAVLHLFAPRPPGQFGSLIDPVWDAGAPGPRDVANLLFKGNLYGLLSEAGTYPDAGAPGARDVANMKFPDGTFADAKGTGTGKA